MMICSVCGGAVFAGNEASGYAGPICVQGGYHGPYIAPQAAPNDEYIRRIVREELRNEYICKQCGIRKDADHGSEPTF